MAVRGDLYASDQTRRYVLHKQFRPGYIPATAQVRDDQLGISVQRRPCPQATCALRFLFVSDVLILTVAE
jgi:hypothetical protein